MLCGAEKKYVGPKRISFHELLLKVNFENGPCGFKLN